MVRWQPDAVGRLERAALELYAERGFEQTTVAEIAERAGVTERTFFRYFTDKREVLFQGSAELQRIALAAIAASPEPVVPIDAVASAIGEIAGVLQGGRAHARQRAAVVDAHPALRERELLKMESLASAMSVALEARGVPAAAALIAGQAGITVFRISYERWVADSAVDDYRELVRESFQELKAVTAGG